MQLNNSQIRLAWLRNAWRLARPYWTSEEKWIALALLVIVISFNLLNVYMSVQFNKFYNNLYDALQHFNANAFYQLILKFAIMAFTAIGFSVCGYYFRKIIEIRWRKWLTNYYLQQWLAQSAYYQMQFIEQDIDNPDQRISQDVNSFVVTSLSLSLGLLSNIVSLCSFVTILWGLSGALKFTWFNHHFSIAGYMVWVALIYAVIGTYITFKIGQPLIKLNFKQENLEADFRFGLMRVREYSENIAFYRGEAQEQQQLTNKFNVLISNFLATVYQQIKIDIVNVAYSQIANIFPVLVSAPRYFAKVIQLGDVMQIAGAFGHVQGSLSYFIDAYSSLAGLRAVIWRLQEFDHVVEQSHQLVNLYDIHQVTTDETYLVLRHLSVYLPSQQQILLRNVNLKLTSGERLLIQGPSGCGKTTLLRTLAGLWPYAEGEIIHKSNLRELFIGQRPYLPAVSLRDALYYPETANKLANLNIKLEQLLQQCGLMHLIHQLDNIVEWNKILSLGEQQRLAFIRILLQKPDIIYLDEATSALDEAMEALLYQLITQQLPRSLIISIGHRSSLNQWHTQQFYFPRD
ncbi:MAG: hypothetical protein RLZZ293_1389 [Pseudomonadota bacterium]